MVVEDTKGLSLSRVLGNACEYYSQDKKINNKSVLYSSYPQSFPLFFPLWLRHSAHDLILGWATLLVLANGVLENVTQAEVEKELVVYTFSFIFL